MDGFKNFEIIFTFWKLGAYIGDDFVMHKMRFVMLVACSSENNASYPINAERCVQHLLSERLRLSA